MKKLSIILNTLFYASVCCAQVQDNFSDGDLTNNPEWTPDNASNWIVTSNQLRSNSATASSGFYITTPSTKATEAQWEFWVNLQFNTSSTNYADVFLVADQANLHSATLNGYFVRIGGTPDEISLYKLVNGTASILINGIDGVTNSSNITLRIKVIRNAGNLWTLERDAGSGSYFTEGTITDNTFSTSQFFGIRIQQSTASFFNRHFFDNIYAGEIIIDNTPPSYLWSEIQDANHILIGFDEPLQLSSAQNVTNYTASNGLGSPATAQLQPDQKSVRLTFAQSFIHERANTLTINNIADAQGNAMSEYVLPFTYTSPFSYKDIILSEIFADPTPPVDLPEAEFVELYNRSAASINLIGWKFTDGSTTATLPDYLIPSGQRLILTTTANLPLYVPFGNTLGVSGFPTLNNAGEALMLYAPGNHLIDSVNFTLAWYQDQTKQEGGWTLEVIDVDNICGEETNWIASEALLGGTPGLANSVNANKPDLTGPQLLSATVVSGSEIMLTFNEKLEKPVTIQSFSIAPEAAIASVAFSSTALRQVKLSLAVNLQEKRLYTITVTSLRDCAGNSIQETHNKKTFALPELAEPGDVLLNEILFNPRPGGVDFVEIVNVSDKYINLKNWALANYENGVITNAKKINTQDIVLSPGTFLAITSDGGILKNHYPLGIESNFLNAAIPSMNDDAGSMALISDTGITLDFLMYEDDFHTPILKDREGVSLERISTAVSAANPSNWRSASSAAGFATPGFINSNSKPHARGDEEKITIDPEIFSPDRPGQDFAQIRYAFEQTGWVANVKIADQQGRVIKEIANNETLGYEGFFRWDGDRDDSTRARIGYYFVWFEVFQLDGQVKTFRKRVVIAR